MGSDPPLVEFSGAPAMAARLADLIALALDRAVAEQGLASIALSGGATPALLYAALGARAVDWPNVTATLVDERFVAPTAAGSNEGFIRSNFLAGAAARARFAGLRGEAHGLDDAAIEAATRVAGVVRPFDVVVLGMGVDGHTASWFPHASGLREALADNAPLVAPIRAQKSAVTGDDVERLTLSLRAIRDARLIVLLIAGADKRRAFAAACAGGPVDDAPVRAILRARPDLWACWAP
ncbi:MAG: 6-phosphogluconolactonase [Parvularculaceae bacterium]